MKGSERTGSAEKKKKEKEKEKEKGNAKKGGKKDLPEMGQKKSFFTKELSREIVTKLRPKKIEHPTKRKRKRK